MIELPTIVLGIDQAAVSGWAIYELSQRRVTRSGIARTSIQREEAVQRALALAERPRLLLVMFEKHSEMPLQRMTRFDSPHLRRAGPPERNTATILGMGAARGRWEEQLDRVSHPQSLRDEVEPRVWRAAVLQRGHSRNTDWKALACLAASQHVGENVVDHNEAEAVHLARFGGVDGIARLVAARARGRSIAAARKHKQLSLGDEE
jgi:hypothetical protein